MRQVNFKFLAAAVFAVAAFTFSGCGDSTTPSGGGVNPGDSAATVNGKAIKMEEVERAIKAQGQVQEAKLSPLELATARLQIVQNLIQKEVLFQKAEAEKTVPNDDEVNQEYSKLKSNSGVSAEEFEKRMKDAGETEASIKEGIKKDLAINKLVEKITSKVDPPKDSEIEAYYKGNPEAFVKRRGVKLAAIVIDPAKTSEDDKTTNEPEAVAKANEIINQLKAGGDFAAIAREKSEDQSRVQSGDLGYLTEDQVRQAFSPQIAAIMMDPKMTIGQIQATRGQDGRFYILKLQERSDKDENVTLETPNIKQQVIDLLTKSRKDVLSQAYAAAAMNDAKVVNNLAKKIVDNPNELTGARPASTGTPVSTNTAAETNTNTNSNAVVTNTNANATAAKPTASPAAKANTNTK